MQTTIEMYFVFFAFFLMKSNRKSHVRIDFNWMKLLKLAEELPGKEGAQWMLHVEQLQTAMNSNSSSLWGFSEAQSQSRLPSRCLSSICQLDF